MTVRIRRLRPGTLDATALTPSEQQRAAAFRRRADRDRFVTGRMALRVLAGAELDCAPSAIVLGTVGRGKPVVTAPQHLDVGVAHAGDIVLVAVGSAAFGIDVEPPPSVAVVTEVAPRVCSPAELRALRDLRPELRPSAFARMWSRKEAVVKADGAGLALPLSDLHVGVGTTPVPGAVAGWHVRDLDLPLDVPAAVALPTPEMSVVLERHTEAVARR